MFDKLYILSIQICLFVQENKKSLYSMIVQIRKKTECMVHTNNSGCGPY